MAKHDHIRVAVCFTYLFCMKSKLDVQSDSDMPNGLDDVFKEEVLGQLRQRFKQIDHHVISTFLMKAPPTQAHQAAVYRSSKRCASSTKNHRRSKCMPY